MSTMEQRRFGPLTARVVGRGEGPVVVLLHGFGAPGDDLVPLAGALRAPSGTRFVFPEALHALDLGAFRGRAWWRIDVGRYQQAIATGALRDISNEVPAGLADARAAFETALDEIVRVLGVPDDRLFVGGFSQGAMLSTDFVLRSTRPVAGLALFSGALLAADQWKPLMPARSGLACVQSHGTMDPILPYPVGEALRDHLRNAGWKVRFISFAGPHTIPGPALDAFSDLLNVGTTPARR